ncbi:unnamed protein product [Absidia cylindrospora]
MHMKACPLTKFEGAGVDNLGSFTVMGLIDDTEDGQFALPMGICGRWGDEEYGGPWWIWKTSDGSNPDSVPASSLNVK